MIKDKTIFIKKITKNCALCIVNCALTLFIVHCSLFIAPLAADVKYYVGKDGRPGTAEDDGERLKRVYIYGGYGLHLAEDMRDMKAEGYTRAIAGGVGFRFTETIRAELAYERVAAEYDYGGTVNADGHFGFVNFIFDAKLPPKYRLFGTNPLIPFAGFGGGAGHIWFNEDAGAELRKVSFAYNFIGGISVEINRTIALALAYKYIKIVPADLTLDDGATEIRDFSPSGHTLSAHFRMSF